MFVVRHFRAAGLTVGVLTILASAVLAAVSIDAGSEPTMPSGPAPQTPSAPGGPSLPPTLIDDVEELAQCAEVVPNTGGWEMGVTAFTLVNDCDAAVSSAALVELVAQESSRSVLALWYLFGDEFLYWIPDVPGTLSTIEDSRAALYAVLGPRVSPPGVPSGPPRTPSAPGMPSGPAS